MVPRRGKYKYMLITHEFPLQFYLDGTAEKLTDYDYCLAHRYLSNEKYRSYMKEQVSKGRKVYLDNSLYELGKAWDDEEYVSIIKDLQPFCYMLPDMFRNFEGNILSQVEFYKRHPELSSFFNSIPVIIPHANSLKNPDDNLIRSINILRDEIKTKVMIAIPFADYSFENPDNSEDYFTEEDIPYIPLRQAYNRKLFLDYHSKELSCNQIHLLGCKSLAEFDLWSNDFNKGSIFSLDTSHPVAMTLEDRELVYNKGLFTPSIGKDYKKENSLRKYPMHQYKSPYLIDAHFEDSFDKSIYSPLKKNIEHFQNHVRKWGN